MIITRGDAEYGSLGLVPGYQGKKIFYLAYILRKLYILLELCTRINVVLVLPLITIAYMHWKFFVPGIPSRGKSWLRRCSAPPYPSQRRPHPSPWPTVGFLLLPLRAPAPVRFSSRPPLLFQLDSSGLRALLLLLRRAGMKPLELQSEAREKLLSQKYWGFDRVSYARC